MNAAPNRRPDGPTRYEIRLQGRLDARWAASFEPLSLSDDGDGTTVLCGPVADQAALHGVLQRLRDLGLPLIEVARCDRDRHSNPVHRSDPEGETP